jgi:hypothetical protein
VAGGVDVRDPEALGFYGDAFRHRSEGIDADEEFVLAFVQAGECLGPSRSARGEVDEKVSDSGGVCLIDFGGIAIDLLADGHVRLTGPDEGVVAVDLPTGAHVGSAWALGEAGGRDEAGKEERGFHKGLCDGRT